jgi:hypothetical protein
MKQRLSLSVEGATADYLTRRARNETHGNVSAMVDRLVRAAVLAESVRAEARWYVDNPDAAETAETERYAA